MNKLKERGFEVGCKGVARQMRQLGICIRAKRRFCPTTDSKHKLGSAANHLNRQFGVAEAKDAWVGDITYLHTPNGFVYFATVIELKTRRLLGYALERHMRAELVLSALRMALLHEGRAPQYWHSDRGVQYACLDYKKMLKARRITLSMSRKGDCWDNAVSESFFSTFKREVADSFANLRDAQKSVFDFYLFYNQKRKHSSLGYLSPEQYAIQSEIIAQPLPLAAA